MVIKDKNMKPLEYNRCFDCRARPGKRRGRKSKRAELRDLFRTKIQASSLPLPRPKNPPNQENRHSAILHSSKKKKKLLSAQQLHWRAQNPTFHFKMSQTMSNFLRLVLLNLLFLASASFARAPLSYVAEPADLYSPAKPDDIVTILDLIRSRSDTSKLAQVIEKPAGQSFRG